MKLLKIRGNIYNTSMSWKTNAKTLQLKMRLRQKEEMLVKHISFMDEYRSENNTLRIKLEKAEQEIVELKENKRFEHKI